MGANTHSDVLIVGGGLAGLAAAYQLRNTPHTVTLIEANDRLGGRTYGAHWAATDTTIDMGGTWLLPTFARSFELLTELQIDTVESPASDHWFTHLSRGVVEQQALTPDQYDTLRRTLERLTEIVGNAPEPMTAEAALAALAEERDLHDQLIEDWQRAMQRYLAGAPLTEVGAEHLLLALDDVADPEHYHTQIAGTTAALYGALADALTAQVHLDTRATRVEYRDDTYRVTSADGTVFTAAALILAIPLNTLARVDIQAGLLDDHVQLARTGHVGASRKDWMILDGVGAHFRVFASHGPYGYFRSEAMLDDGGVLCVGLVPSAEGTPSVSELEAAIRTHYLPEAVIREYTTHDWLADPNARGTWFVPRPGQYSELAELTPGAPNLFVVGGDVDTEFPGTIEGAIVSGERAARALSL